MSYLSGFTFLFLSTLLGMGLARKLGRQLGAIGWVALGAVCGLLAVSALAIVIDLSPLRIDAITLRALVAGLAGLAAFWLWRSPAGPFGAGPVWRPYEWLTLLVLVLILFPSIWKAAVLPVSVRDTVVGADLVAIYAVQEGTIASQVFTGAELEGQLSNQPFYAPFTMTQQVAWRLLGFPMGTLWLSWLVASVTIVFYTWLRRRLHPALAGFWVFIMTTTPLLFTFTYLISTDYPSAAFVGLAGIFAAEHARTRTGSDRDAAALFLGAAVWTRAETILLVLLIALAELFASRASARSRLGTAIALFLPSLLAVLVWHGLYVGERLPGAPEVLVSVNRDSFPRIVDSATEVFGYFGIQFSFAGTFLLGGAWFLGEFIVAGRRLDWRPILWILASLVAFFLVLGIFPAAGTDTTVKRGYIKIVFLLIVFVGTSRLGVRFSKWLHRFEYPAPPDPDPDPDQAGTREAIERPGRPAPVDRSDRVSEPDLWAT